MKVAATEVAMGMVGVKTEGRVGGAHPGEGDKEEESRSNIQREHSLGDITESILLETCSEDIGQLFHLSIGKHLFYFLTKQRNNMLK